MKTIEEWMEKVPKENKWLADLLTGLLKSTNIKLDLYQWEAVKEALGCIRKTRTWGGSSYSKLELIQLATYINSLA